MRHYAPERQTCERLSAAPRRDFPYLGKSPEGQYTLDVTTPPETPDGNVLALNVSCPHCSAHVGRPVSVSTRKGVPGVVDVQMRCTTCQHSWIVPKLTHADPAA
jgi:hypothetical protein